jgi:isoleucyl-tRNA synthetase
MAQDPKSPSLTLNMPETSFPMRGDMPKREPEFLKFWKEENIYESRLTQNASTGKRFSLADGPPYANGAIHHGHILNKILKDIVSKYQSMQGAVVKFTPGWDCHGLPIERAAAKDIKDFDKKSPNEIRSACRSYAQTWIDKQSSEFQRLGILADWEKPYRTMDFPYEARTAAVFGQMVREGLVYLGAKPVHWCPVDGTALAEAEVEYQPKQSSSIYVKFQVRSEDHAALLSKIGHPTPNNGAPVSVVIWTTTPWTLPANLAVSAHPEFEYVVM